jgi:hypothetical protein
LIKKREKSWLLKKCCHFFIVLESLLALCWCFWENFRKLLSISPKFTLDYCCLLLILIKFEKKPKKKKKHWWALIIFRFLIFSNIWTPCMFVNNAMSSCFAITKPMIVTHFHHNACDDTLWILSCTNVITWHQSSCLVKLPMNLSVFFWEKNCIVVT